MVSVPYCKKWDACYTWATVKPNGLKAKTLSPIFRADLALLDTNTLEHKKIGDNFFGTWLVWFNSDLHVKNGK